MSTRRIVKLDDALNAPAEAPRRRWSRSWMNAPVAWPVPTARVSFPMRVIKGIVITAFLLLLLMGILIDISILMVALIFALVVGIIYTSMLPTEHMPDEKVAINSSLRNEAEDDDPLRSFMEDRGPYVDMFDLKPESIGFMNFGDHDHHGGSS